MSAVDSGGIRQLEVGVLGATGMVGQQFVRLLDGHPWFKTAWLGASERSEGRTYGEAMKWRLSTPPPVDVLGMNVDACTPGRAPKVLFSALDAGAAKEIEPAFAAAGHIVVSNARNYRMFADVPLVIPEVNPDHLALIARQRRERGWSGAIVTNPNCSTVVLSVVARGAAQFGLSRVMVTTLQAVSGAGYPGVASLDILGNVIPAISGEEEKMESETQKILGTLERDGVTPHPMVVSAHDDARAGHRRPHRIDLDRVRKPSVDRGRAHALEGFRGRPQQLELPSAPPAPIVYMEAADRPQPRLDVERGNGMTVSVGRLRRCPILGTSSSRSATTRFAVRRERPSLNAEIMVAEGMLD